jgi:hypothetical protein
MLELQAAVSQGTRCLAWAIQTSADRKPGPDQRLVARRLAADEKQLVREATRAIEKLQADDYAPAFTEVFQQLRKDMERLRKRLQAGDVGEDTAALGQEILSDLDEMVRALRKR